MISFNAPSNSPQSNIGIFIDQHITVQAAAEATGYNIQYLRRILRSGALKGCKIGQMWLIEMGCLGRVSKTHKNHFRPPLRATVVFFNWRVNVDANPYTNVYGSPKMEV